MDRKTILILGGAQMQLPAITIAKRLGWTVVVADRDAGAPGVRAADRFFHVDLSDRERMAAAAAEYKRSHGLDGVFTAGTDFSATVAWVAQELGLPGIAYRVARDASDKARMRAVFRSKGLKSPPFVLLRRADEWPIVLEQLDLPVVVKPVDNMGSRGVRRVDAEGELAAAIEEASRFARSGNVIVESFLDGPEFSLDALVFKGNITLCGVADRHIFFPPFFVEMGHTMPSLADEEVIRAVTDVFFQGVRALGIDNGAAKGDIKFTGDGAYIGEIAARLSGGYMSGWTFPYASGVQVTEGALRIAVGMEPGDLTPVRAHVSAERAFISIAGTVASVEGVEEAGAIDGVRDVFLRTASGERVVFPTNNVQKCGNVITRSSCRAEAVSAAERACRTVFIRLAPGDERTREFLYATREPWIPEAFRIEIPENLEALEAMKGLVSRSRRHSDTAAAAAVVTLPRLSDEPGVDWHGMSLREAFERVVDLTGILPVSLEEARSAAGAVAGAEFWRALLRGGVQGGVWSIETEGAGI